MPEKPIHHINLKNICVLGEGNISTAINTENCNTENVRVGGKEFLLEN
jgi:hypothetical protein